VSYKDQTNSASAGCRPEKMRVRYSFIDLIKKTKQGVLIVNIFNAVEIAGLEPCANTLFPIALALTGGRASQNDRRLLLWDYVSELNHVTDWTRYKLSFDIFGRQRGTFRWPLKSKPGSLSYPPNFSVHLREALKIGQLMIGLSSSDRYRSIRLGAALELSQIVNTNSQFKTYMCAAGDVVGVLTWAWVDDR
jgi:hypothetical protein